MCKQLCSKTMNVEARSEKEHFKFIKLILINWLIYLLMHTMANKFGYYCNVIEWNYYHAVFYVYGSAIDIFKLI